jgi:hypothetical protein
MIKIGRNEPRVVGPRARSLVRGAIVTASLSLTSGSRKYMSGPVRKKTVAVDGVFMKPLAIYVEARSVAAAASA